MEKEPYNKKKVQDAVQQIVGVLLYLFHRWLAVCLKAIVNKLFDPGTLLGEVSRHICMSDGTF